MEIFAGCLGPGPALDTTLARAQEGDSLGHADPDSTLFLPSNSFMLFLLLHNQIIILNWSDNNAMLDTEKLQSQFLRFVPYLL